MESKVEATPLGDLGLLPLELRQQIYTYTQGDPLHITVDLRRTASNTDPSECLPPLLKVSTRIRAEIIQILRIHLFIFALEPDVEPTLTAQYIPIPVTLNSNPDPSPDLEPYVRSPVPVRPIPLPLWIRTSTIAITANTADPNFTHRAITKTSTSFPNLQSLILGRSSQRDPPPSHPHLCSRLLSDAHLVIPSTDEVYAGAHDDFLALDFQDSNLQHWTELPVRGEDRGYAVFFRGMRRLVWRKPESPRGMGYKMDVISMLWDYDNQVFVERVKPERSSSKSQNPLRCECGPEVCTNTVLEIQRPALPGSAGRDHIR